MTMTHVDEAAALDTDAEEYPGERGEILLEAAAAWRKAGRSERAAELLVQLVGAGGEDGCYARVQVAKYCFADGNSGAPSIRVVPATVAGLCDFAERTGVSPTDSETRAAYVNRIPSEQMIVWPPQRITSCWCGSGTKYKKCCAKCTGRSTDRRHPA